jgi:hypothetical protein
MRDTAARTLLFKLAEAEFRNSGNFRYETISPFLSYSLFQAAVVHHRLWRLNNDPTIKHSFEMLKSLLNDIRRRWLVAG